MTGFLHHVFSRFHQFLLPYPQIGTICSHSTLDNMWITTKAGVHAQRIKYTNVCCKQCCMYCLKSGAVMSNDYVVLMRDNARNKYELEADEFAGNLLAPRFMLDKYYERLSIAKMSQLFAISVPAIKVRLSKEYGI